MGWASATEIFDKVVDVALELYVQPLFHGGFPPDAEAHVVKRMYTEVDWDDWDTQDESRYFDPYLRDVMEELGELDDDY